MADAQHVPAPEPNQFESASSVQRMEDPYHRAAVPAPPHASLPARRPAETGTAVAAAVAFLLGRLLGWDGATQGAVTVLVGALPSGVTWLVELRRRR